MIEARDLVCPILTKRLRLAPVTTGDADALFALLSDRDTVGSACDVHVRPEQSLRLARALSDAHAARAWFVGSDRDPALGLVSVHDVEGACGQLAFMIAGAHRRRGYAREAVDAVIGYCTGLWRLQRLEATTARSNLASRALLARAGFEVVRSGADEELFSRRLAIHRTADVARRSPICSEGSGAC